MSEDDPRRIDEIRKYASIYGRYDCKRNPEKPLSMHEVGGVITSDIESILHHYINSSLILFFFSIFK